MIQELYREFSALREQFDAHWKEAGHIGFNSENPYYEPIRNLVARINERLMLGEALVRICLQPSKNQNKDEL